MERIEYCWNYVLVHVINSPVRKVECQLKSGVLCETADVVLSFKTVDITVICLSQRLTFINLANDAVTFSMEFKLMSIEIYYKYLAYCFCSKVYFI